MNTSAKNQACSFERGEVNATPHSPICSQRYVAIQFGKHAKVFSQPVVYPRRQKK